MNRRNLLAGLSGILASGFAPAAIGSGVLMPVRQPIISPQITVIKLPNMWLEWSHTLTDAQIAAVTENPWQLFC